jgi:hypothetical protein
MVVKGATLTGQVHLVDAGGNDVAATSSITITVTIGGGNFGAPSPVSVIINPGSAVSGNFTSTTPSGQNKTGTLSGTTTTSGLTVQTVNLST